MPTPPAEPSTPELARLKAFIRALPKTETHLHLEGALPWELLHRADPDRFEEPPLSWRDGFRFDSFAQFESELLDMAGVWFTSAERYRQAARQVFQRHLQQNVRYVETSIASGVIEHYRLNAREVVAAVRDAVPTGLEVRLFLGIHHNGYHDRTRSWLDDCVHWPELDGLDLHGTESFPLEDWTARLWRKAREAGKFTKAHAGEFEGPAFVRRVLRELEVRRLEHGVRAAEDPELVSQLVEAGVVLDVCPVSNVKLRVVKSLREHPLRALLQAGVICTISTDDPISFGNTLLGEYRVLATEAGFDKAELARLAGHGFEAALLPEPMKAACLREIDEVLRAHQSASLPDSLRPPVYRED